ncbi:MAG: glycosyltransferase family 2 protein [Lachnospiraceae bacterium]|nr:glycosyltransferase family 2 protein [Lachnospiraceae bacterium]
MNKTVSIIIPVYNAEKVIRRCVDSVLKQEYKDFELILMDDGSKDSSPKILDEYAALDQRVRVIHQENAGVSAARNHALDLAEGTYIQFLDADDWITQDATKLLVRAAQEQNADMVISDFYRVVGERTSRKGDIEADGVISREEYGNWMLKNPADYYYGVLWNKLFRRDIIEKYSLRMDPELKWCEDFIFNMEYVLHTERIAVLSVPIYYYVKTEGSLVQQGMNVSGIVRMKLGMIEYYNGFYKRLYTEEEYQKRKPEIYQFLVAYAGDDAAIPGMPGTRKLGKERIPVALKIEQESDVFMDHYYTGKLLDRYLQTAAQQSGLELGDVKLVLYLYYSGDQPHMQEAVDFTGLSSVQVLLSLQKLVYKKLARYRVDAAEFTLNAVLTDKADAVLALIREAQSDFVTLRYGKMREEELEKFKQTKKQELDRIRNVLI